MFSRARCVPRVCVGVCVRAHVHMRKYVCMFLSLWRAASACGSGSRGRELLSACALEIRRVAETNKHPWQVSSWLSADESNFVDDNNEQAALWRVAFHSGQLTEQVASETESTREGVSVCLRVPESVYVSVLQW